MAALAAIVNKAAANDESINLFFNTSRAQLGISIQSGTDDDNPADDIWEPDDDDYDGYILNPSSMAAVYYRGLNFVAAVTMPKLGPNETQTVNQLSLVSPVYQRLGTAALDDNHIALCTNPNGNKCWLYYFGDLSTPSKTIKELSLSTGNSQTFDTISDAIANSSLAAWYDPDQQAQHVIYESSALRELDVVKKEAIYLPLGSSAPNTSLAVAYSSTTKKVYLYLYDVKRNLTRIIKNGDIWGPSFEQIGNAPEVAEGSQITVAQANGYNHVFYIAKDSGMKDSKAFSAFTHIRDKID
ncbi:hypothetical protein F4779DRAFT_592012 [Xylariaceae sp. FL0662B]|nr:hypothetical protein F4779DRAFT_592012 [Xylariaceae sp. FL0662B]